MQMGWMVGTNAQGVRGALATHSYKPGDIITVVPRNITFDLGPQEWTAPVRPSACCNQPALCISLRHPGMAWGNLCPANHHCSWTPLMVHYTNVCRQLIHALMHSAMAHVSSDA